MRTLAAMCVVLVLAGCSSDVRSTPISTPTGESDHAREVRRENLRADCMKRKGFVYAVNVPPEEWGKVTGRDVGDYEAMKADREEHGFYLYYHLIYKEDKRGKPMSIPDPNNEITGKLSKVQRAAWDEASSECFRQSVKTFYNMDVKDEFDFTGQQVEAQQKVLQRELNGDDQLIALGQKFGDCLKSAGYRVPSLRPTDLATRGRFVLQDEMTALARQQGQKGDPPKGGYLEPQLTKAEATTHFRQEVKAALDDLECGRDFYAAYLPKNLAISERVSASLGMGHR